MYALIVLLPYDLIRLVTGTTVCGSATRKHETEYLLDTLSNCSKMVSALKVPTASKLEKNCQERIFRITFTLEEGL
jgi:hypothetical protein